MKKTISALLALSFSILLASCGGSSSSSSMISSSSSSSSSEEVKATNDLAAFFLSMKSNDFSVDFTDSYLNYDNIERHQQFYYTPYSFQSDGDFGFKGIAQGDDLIFSYTIDDDEEISSSAPLVSSSTGLRYSTVYSYYTGFADFDIAPINNLVKGDDGFYTYKFAENASNDKIMTVVLLHYNINPPIYPEEVKLKPSGNSLTVEATTRIYDDADKNYVGKDTVSSRVYGVGTTNNSLIKDYLDNGEGAKKPLSNRFFSFFAPYLDSYNYKVSLDASGLGSTYTVDEYFTENAIFYDFPATSSNTDSGQILDQGAVSNFTVENDKLKLGTTPLADSDGTFYTAIWGDVLSYSFTDLYYENLVGYVDEGSDDSFYLTDSQAIFTLAYLSVIESYDTFKTVSCRIDITDFEKHEFTATFGIYNSTSNVFLGNYVSKFSGLNNTSIAPVDRYFNEGDDPKSQTKEEFKTVMELFKNGNYSLDVLTTGSGMAKFYFTENYFYEELYADSTTNTGFIKQDDHIYSFSIVDGAVKVVTTQDYASGTSPMTLPGCGSYLFASNDLSYISHFSDDIYSYDDYEVTRNSGVTYWKNTKTGFSSSMYNYFFNSNSSYLPMGSGFKVSLGADPYDTRVTLYSTIKASDGSYESYGCLTFYDLNNTGVPLVDSYLNA